MAFNHLIIAVHLKKDYAMVHQHIHLNPNTNRVSVPPPQKKWWIFNRGFFISRGSFGCGEKTRRKSSLVQLCTTNIFSTCFLHTQTDPRYLLIFPSSKIPHLSFSPNSSVPRLELSPSVLSTYFSHILTEPKLHESLSRRKKEDKVRNQNTFNEINPALKENKLLTQGAFPRSCNC